MQIKCPLGHEFEVTNSQSEYAIIGDGFKASDCGNVAKLRVLSERSDHHKSVDFLSKICFICPSCGIVFRPKIESKMMDQFTS